MRARLPAQAEHSKRAWRVERLDRTGHAYFLVILGNASSPSGVCAVDAHTGEALSSARLSGNRPHLMIDATAALKIANVAGGHARLVWRPCQASMSLLYPFGRLQIRITRYLSIRKVNAGTPFRWVKHDAGKCHRWCETDRNDLPCHASLSQGLGRGRSSSHSQPTQKVE